MNALLSKILPISLSKVQENEDEDENNSDYSFAIEYNGPPLSYNIPRAIPVNINRIPVASIASNRSIETNLSPVIHPIVNNDPLRKLGYKRSGELVDVQVTSSGSLQFSDNSRELSGTSEIEDLNDDNEDALLSDDDISDSYVFEDENIVDDRARRRSQETSEIEDLNDDNEEALISDDDISDTYVFEDENIVDDRAKRPSNVTFHEPESSNVLPEVISRRPEIKPNLKKGSCYHCLKKIRFYEREVCIVCNAKYCVNCVIRAMGSMPEGRKCINCIRYAIDESKRGILGKPSRLLRRLLTDVEIKNIMKNEMFCESNRLPSTLVYVNGKPLCSKEFILLQNCLYPPRKIEPGRYWYDKTAGFWGKEGQKPCQIISPELAVGGEILRNSSDGRTNVVINKREITKAERRVLQWAGIRCEGCPSFWLGADGSLQEEGMNNVIAKIWDKSGIHLVCSLLSLPIPPQSANPLKNEAENVADRAESSNLDNRILHKLLLVGSDQSGTSTIFKQARMVHHVHFTDDERENIKTMMQTSLYTYLGLLLEGREQFEEENSQETTENSSDQTDQEKGVYFLGERLRSFSDWFIQEMLSGNLEVVFSASSRIYSPVVLELLKNKAIQATYNRMNELHMVPRVAKYVLDRAVEILRVDYEPSDTDILKVDGITSSNGLASMEFSFPRQSHDTADSHDLHPRKYQLIRIHSTTLGHKCKWLEMFEDSDLVLFTVSLTDYDQYSHEKNGNYTNKMLQSKNLFENIATHPSFHNKNFLLLLNKFDLLEEKIGQAPLSLCEWFYDFDPVISLHPRSHTSVYPNPSLAQRGFHYIGTKFKELFRSLTGRKLHVSMVNGLEPKSVDQALKYAREILNWEEEKPSFIAPDTSSFSNEASTST